MALLQTPTPQDVVSGAVIQASQAEDELAAAVMFVTGDMRTMRRAQTHSNWDATRILDTMLDCRDAKVVASNCARYLVIFGEGSPDLEVVARRVSTQEAPQTECI